MKTPIVNSTIQLQKFQGKGGWTYVSLPELKSQKGQSFGWMEVNGSIDSYEISNYKLMPLGNGNLFLPIKTEIRKAIKKEVGDSVKVILFATDSSSVSISEIEDCIADVPDALAFFNTLKSNQRKQLLDWMAAPTVDEQKVNRINKVITFLSRNIYPDFL